MVWSKREREREPRGKGVHYCMCSNITGGCWIHSAEKENAGFYCSHLAEPYLILEDLVIWRCHFNSSEYVTVGERLRFIFFYHISSESLIKKWCGGDTEEADVIGAAGKNLRWLHRIRLAAYSFHCLVLIFFFTIKGSWRPRPIYWNSLNSTVHATP